MVTLSSSTRLRSCVTSWINVDRHSRSKGKNIVNATKKISQSFIECPKEENKHNAIVAVDIFVNPMSFRGQNEVKDSSEVNFDMSIRISDQLNMIYNFETMILHNFINHLFLKILACRSSQTLLCRKS